MPSIFLGAVELTPLEVTQIYQSIGSRGLQRAFAVGDSGANGER